MWSLEAGRLESSTFGMLQRLKFMVSSVVTAKGMQLESWQSKAYAMNFEEQKPAVIYVRAAEAQAQIDSHRLKDFIIFVQFVLIAYLFFF